MKPSTLEVAPHDGLEVVHHDEGLHYTPTEYTGYGEMNINHKLYSTHGGPPQQKKICGLSRPIFWLAVAMAALAAIVVGLGIGLGVALGNRNKAQSANTNSGANTTSPPSPPELTATVKISETSTSTSPTPTSPTSTPSTTISSTSTSSGPTPTDDLNLFDTVCPEQHDTLIAASVGDVQYRVLCDSDFGPGGDRTTLGSFDSTTWENCVSLCNTMNYFQDRSDVACTWNAAGTGGQRPGACWCSGGDKIVVENKGNVIAVPQ